MSPSAKVVTKYYAVFVLLLTIIFLICHIGNVYGEEKNISTEAMESYLEQQDTPEGKFAETTEDEENVDDGDYGDDDDNKDENNLPNLSYSSSRAPSSDTKSAENFLEGSNAPTSKSSTPISSNFNFTNSFPAVSLGGKNVLPGYGNFRKGLNTSTLDKSSSMYSTLFLPPLFAAAPFAYYPPLFPVFPPQAPAALTGGVVPPLFSAPTLTAAGTALPPTQPFYWGQVYDPRLYYILGEEPKKPPKRRKKFKNKLMKKLFEKKNPKDEVIFIPMGNSMIFIREN